MKTKNTYKFKTLSLIVLLLAMVSWQAVNAAEVVKEFTQRTAAESPERVIYNIKGDFQMIGNANLTGVSYNPVSYNTNMKYVDIDEDPYTINSSSATLQFSTENGAKPQCSNVIFAGLYWTGRAHDGVSPSTFTITYPAQTLSNNNTVTGTNPLYKMTITRQGSNGSYFIRYTFAPETGTGSTYVFDFTNSTNNNQLITVSVNGGAISYIPASVTTSGNDKTATFTTPYTIGNFVVTGLKRDSRTNNNIDANNSRGYVKVNDKNVDKRKVKLKKAGQSYQTITANPTDIYFPTTDHGVMYTAYAEVTDYVRQHGTGEYFVADMALQQGNGGDVGYYGGWGMIVVYENSKMNWRDITIFDGHAYVEPYGGTKEISISGFNTAQYGPIDMKLGVMAGEGDVANTQDFLEIQKLNTNQWVRLSHGGNSIDNFFNSSIYTGGNARNPENGNNYGTDISMFKITNTGNSIITNNQTSTKFRYGTNADTYVIYCLAMAVDAYIPDLVPYIEIGTVNGQPYTSDMTILPGEELEYTLELKNPGNEFINNAAINIPIPYTASFVSASAVHPHTTGGEQPILLGTTAKSIQWNIGNITLKESQETVAKLTFKLRATSDCYLLTNEKCRPKILIQGGASGQGATSQRPFTDLHFVKGYRMDGECVNEPISGPLSIDINTTEFVATCPAEETSGVLNFDFCQKPEINYINFHQIANKFPLGSRFWSAITQEIIEGDTYVKPAEDAIEYTSATNFPNYPLNVVQTYYALPPGGATTCWWEAKILVKSCNLWLGEKDTNWNDPLNWTLSKANSSIPVPNGAEKDVVFATEYNYTRNADRNLVLDQNRIIGNITNESDKALVIPANKTLVIDKKANTGLQNQLIIQAESGTANGALIFNKPSQNQAVQATVEFISKSQPGEGTWPRVWQFFGVPIVDKTLENLFGANAYGSIYGYNPTSSIIVRKYNEALNIPENKQEKWENLDVTSKMQPYYAYEITQPTPNMKHSLKGTLVSDTIKTLKFTISPVGVFSRGNYILANPYTAPILITKMAYGDFVNLAKTIYIYNTGSRKDWELNSGASQVGNLPGTYTAIPVNNATTLLMPQIPSMQAFMLKAISDNPSLAPETKFTFRYETVKRGTLTGNNDPMRARKADLEGDDTQVNSEVKPLIKMDVIGENSSDRVYLITADGTTKGYDNGWDGYKTLASNDMVQLYAMDINNKLMQVNTDEDITETFIGFRTSGESFYTLKFTFNEKMPGIYESLFISDLVTGTTKEIVDGMTMNFAPDANKTEKRFKITGSKVKTGIGQNTASGPSAFVVFADDAVFTVKNSAGEPGTMTVYNLMGQPMMVRNVVQGTQTISHNLQKGTYIIETKTIDNGNRNILKVIIK